MAQLPLTFARVSRPPSDEPRIYTVTEINRRLRGELERNHAKILVAGEVSNLTIHRVSGHAYFTLKDDAAQLSCVMWRDNVRRLRFDLEAGQEVIATGRVTVYERGGRLQLSVGAVELQGLGALQAAYRQLADKLRGEGLTADDRKRPLPLWPRCVGVVTSRQAAALRDVLRTILRRDPFAHVVLSPCAVQGTTAAQEIAEAVDRLDALRRCDVVLVVRGGGSVEDLWAFNEEPVARAIVACSSIVVTGVGHETDTTIADLVADRAASTPTAAAELAVPVRSELRQRWSAEEGRLHRAMSARIERLSRRLLESQSRLQDPRSAIRRRAQRIDDLALRAERRIGSRLVAETKRLRELTDRLEARSPHARVARMSARLDLLLSRSDAAVRRHVDRAARRHALLAGRLEGLSPVSILARGYAVVRDEAGRVVRSASDVAIQDELVVRLGAGRLKVSVDAIDPAD